TCGRGTSRHHSGLPRADYRGGRTPADPHSGRRTGGGRMKPSMRLLVWAGGVALLFATVIDTIAVIGRHIGLPLAGSIELMQAAVLVSGAVGLLVATIEQSHARVHLLVERL